MNFNYLIHFFEWKTLPLRFSRQFLTYNLTRQKHSRPHQQCRSTLPTLDRVFLRTSLNVNSSLSSGSFIRKFRWRGHYSRYIDSWLQCIYTPDHAFHWVSVSRHYWETAYRNSCVRACNRGGGTQFLGKLFLYTSNSGTIWGMHYTPNYTLMTIFILHRFIQIVIENNWCYCYPKLKDQWAKYLEVASYILFSLYSFPDDWLSYKREEVEGVRWATLVVVAV